MTKFTLRLEKDEEVYAAANKPKGCIYCNKEMLFKEFSLWVLLWNKFPYTRVSVANLMIAPKRHISRMYALTTNELNQLEHIKVFLEETYGFNQFVENGKGRQTVPKHYHLHALILKEHESDTLLTPEEVLRRVEEKDTPVS